MKALPSSFSMITSHRLLLTDLAISSPTTDFEYPCEFLVGFVISALQYSLDAAAPEMAGLLSQST